jgi:HipA-like protein
MDKKAKVYFDGRYAGILEGLGGKKSRLYSFVYDREYLADPAAQPVSLTLPKQVEPYLSPVLFPFFYGLLAEGRIKELQCKMLKIDEHDHFERLIMTAGDDSIGTVTVRRDTEI